ncbi:hypothetical protein HOC99_05325 [Candidatus Woesearchaeota archaeon]|jgi:hypothetical protein|nr:hypothetical protein [Candidatus Woesearchaeota archaeon]MBT4388061.1 hypothetical protein [Candidatus Woesearchaeota archaeon]MBT4596326.1 hypothetical protein [Candidatus Woesearchaeota archaeon]MBT5740828.1 hypothetical protein [Candidatus Woesearchaeota archaeon]MBT7848989.1 hypothetical protein [Candidatus Woesearchaeota archaeon]
MAKEEETLNETLENIDKKLSNMSYQLSSIDSNTDGCIFPIIKYGLLASIFIMSCNRPTYDQTKDIVREEIDIAAGDNKRLYTEVYKNCKGLEQIQQQLFSMYKKQTGKNYLVENPETKLIECR